MGKESGLARVHRASQGGSARPQCPNGTPSAPPPHSPLLGPSGELGPAGPFKAGWVRLLSCGSSSSLSGLPRCCNEFPRPEPVAGPAQGRAAAFPTYFPSGFTGGGWASGGAHMSPGPAELCQEGSEASSHRHQPLCPKPGQAPGTAGSNVVGRGAGWSASQGLRPGGPGQQSSQLTRGLG